MKAAHDRHCLAGHEAALRVRHLSFAYGDSQVLRRASFHIQPQSFTVLLGRNGSGKSTLFRLLVGLLKPQEGSIAIFGRDLHRLSLKERTRLLGFLPQHHHAVFPFSVEDVVLTGRAAHAGLVPKARDREAAREALELLGMEHLASKPYTELSGGEQQLVLIARVLAQKPQVLLLDEPTSHLDFVNAHRLMALVRDSLCTSMTVVAIVHDPNLAFQHGTDFFFLADGRVFQPDPGQDPWSSAMLQRVYGVPMETVPFGKGAVVVPRDFSRPTRP